MSEQKPSETSQDSSQMKKAQAMTEYVIALFLCALVAYGAFKMYSSAMRVHYNDVVRARTGYVGMRP